MRRRLVFGGHARPASRSHGPLACLAFVLVLSMAFWAAAVWTGRLLLELSTRGF